MIEKISPHWAERLDHFRFVAKHKMRPSKTIKNYRKSQLRMSFWRLAGRPYAAVVRMENRVFVALKRWQQPQP